MSSFAEMTYEEYFAISMQPGFDWRQFYWMGSPKVKDLVEKPWTFLSWCIDWIGFHTAPTQRDIRKTVRKYGKFDPFWPVNIVEG